MTAPLRWDLPIYTVPDERNPVPVRCEVISPADATGGWAVKIMGDWVSCANLGNQVWIYDDRGAPEQVSGGLPRLQNLPEETAS